MTRKLNLSPLLNLTIRGRDGRQDIFSIPISVSLSEALSTYCAVTKQHPSQVTLVNVSFAHDPAYNAS